MGLIKAAMGAVGGVLGDQWKEFFYCIIKWGIGLVAVNMPDGESYRLGRVE